MTTTENTWFEFAAEASDYDNTTWIEARKMRVSEHHGRKVQLSSTGIEIPTRDVPALIEFLQTLVEDSARDSSPCQICSNTTPDFYCTHR